MKPIILVAHPGQQHSFRTFEALKMGGYDVRYATTVYNRKGSLTRLLSNLLLKGDNLRRANARQSEIINDNEIIQYCEFWGLITLVLIRIDKSKKYYRAWNGFVIRRFGKKIAKYVEKNKIDCLIMYDSSAKPCFEILNGRQVDVVKVLDVSSAARPFQVVEYQKDIDSTGLNGVYKERSFMWNQKQIRYFTDEINLADKIICPSKYVRNSVIYCGANKKNIAIVPYGVDGNKFTYSDRKVHIGPLKIVMTANLSYMKGTHHLLKVINEFFPNDVELHIFGPNNAVDAELERMANSKNVYLRGYVPQGTLNNEYATADLFILPSLGEGFALSVLEAMAAGLPVIVSDHTGAKDIINTYQNGIVFETGNDEALRAAIQWMIDNRNKIPEIGKNAYETTQKYQWSNYYNNYASVISEYLDSRDL